MLSGDNRGLLLEWVKEDTVGPLLYFLPLILRGMEERRGEEETLCNEREPKIPEVIQEVPEK